MKRLLFTCAALGVGVAAVIGSSAVRAAALPACDADNGGLTLPSGFCALVVANKIGTARHLTVASNGDVFVALQNGGIVALRDTHGDGRLDMKEQFGEHGGTGIALRNGYLYFATPTTVERYKMPPGSLRPAGPPEIVVTDLPVQRVHQDKGIAFDGKGSLYLNVGAPSNACQSSDPRPSAPGQDPCPLLEHQGGIWRFDENKLGQTEQAGTRFATGLRQMLAVAWHDGALYIAMNNRDQLDLIRPGVFTAEDNATRPAEPLYRAEQGSNFGWPYCFFDLKQQKLVLNPEYGGDGKKFERCAPFALPVVAFPAHWAPVDLMFYTAAQFPKRYQGGAFVAFHGSWNRSPLPQEGYNITFQPFNGAKPAGQYKVFAGGFAGRSPLMRPDEAAARPDGVAQGPDGSLYIAESRNGKIWRVIYRGT